MTDIIWYDTIDSTNSQAKRILPELGATTVLAARTQTAGRGQRGNRWNSEAGSNLTFSLVLKFGDSFLKDIPVDCQFVISEAVALGVRDYLKTENTDAKIKWPNDIYVNDSKICGILIENTVHSGMLTSCIAGVGLNLNQTGFPPEIPNPVSLKLLTGRHYSIDEALIELVTLILRRLDQAYEMPAQLKEAYLGCLYRKNESHRYMDCATGNEFIGIIRGISDTALLQVELPDGVVKEFAFKEIGYIIS